MNNAASRYVDVTVSNLVAVELSFLGGSPSPGNKNPDKTDVVMRVLSRSNPHWETSPWIEACTRHLGDLIMPSGAWNGIKITEAVGARLFCALSNHVAEIDPRTGDQMWSVETGNTPIYWMMKTPDETALIVFNGYYGFARSDGGGNIVSLTFTGEERWRAEVPAGDVFANHPRYFERQLKASTWSGLDCTLDPATGRILQKEFTK